MKKRLFTVVLALCLVFALGTVTALADDMTVVTADQLMSAIENAQDGGIITLGEDIKLDFSEEILDEANYGYLVPLIDIYNDITIDLNGKSITWNYENSGSLPTTPAMFSINGANVVLTGDGTIDVEAGNNGSYGIDIINGGSLIIESGTYTGATSAVQVSDGRLKIYGGTFKQAATIASIRPDYAKYVINCYDSAYKTGDAEIAVYGGTFVGFNPADDPEGEGTSYVPSGIIATTTTDTVTYRPEADVSTGVAEVNGIYFDSLGKAVDAALNGDTVTLLENIDLTQTLTINDGKTLTIDLNGNDITNSNRVIEIQNAHVSFIGEGTIKEISPYYGAIVLKGSNNPEDENYTSVVIGEDVTLEAWSAVFITPYESSGAPYAYGVQADIYGTLSGVDDTSGEAGSAIYINGQIKHKDNYPVINIYPTAVLNSSGLIYAAGYAEWNIDGASISGYSAGIGAKAGIINITGNANIRCTGPNTAPTEGYSNGINGSGAAIQIESNSGYAGDVVLNIYDATIISENGYAIYEYANGSDPLNVDEINIVDGTFIGTLDQVFCVSSAMEQVGNAVLNVEGGNYSTQIPLTFLAGHINAELYSPSSAPTPYSYFTSVEAALAAARPGDEITYIGDSTVQNYELKVDYGFGDVITLKVSYGYEFYLPELTRNGYTFGGWRGGDGTTYRGGQTVEITSDTTFTAIWNVINIPDTYDIELIVGEGGEASTSLSNASAGSTITVTVTPDEGFELAYITVDGERISGTTFTMPDHDVTVRVYFTDGSVNMPFVDVNRGDWFYEYVEYVYANGLMDGVGDGLFNPDGEMTRAMLWTILARIDGQTVTGESWIETARAWAIAEGVSDGENANGLVTREQFATMLWRYVGEPASSYSLSAYTDAASVSDWAETAMRWAVDNGIITGVTDTTLDPQGTATRAQSAAMLMRFMEL